MKLEMYALYRMIYECCGEDQEVLENAQITEIAPNKYHVEHNISNPCTGVGFDVEITIRDNMPRTMCQNSRIAHYNVTNSVYGDDGEFDFAL